MYNTIYLILLIQDSKPDEVWDSNSYRIIVESSYKTFCSMGGMKFVRVLGSHGFTILILTMAKNIREDLT
jgi:hypothetical protein